MVTQEEELLIARGLLIASPLVVAAGIVSYLLLRPAPPVGLVVGKPAFQVKPLAGMTTTREATGETAFGFLLYPAIVVTADVNGDFTIEHTHDHFFDAGDRVPGFPKTWSKTVSLIAGVPTEIPLEDMESRYPELGYPSAMTDDDFIAYGKQDGLWHAWRVLISGHVTSPSGAVRGYEGTFQENFKSVGVLSVTPPTFLVSPTIY